MDTTGHCWFTLKYYDMDEIALIKKYLDKYGTTVINVEYYTEGHLAIADADVWNLGIIAGETVTRVWMFGNVHINTTIAGVINLADQNMLNLQFLTAIPGITEVGYAAHTMGVNLGMSLMGNGEYEGNKRLYGMGFNRVVTNTNDFGAATFAVRYCFNGYRFRIK
jgi:hypothetical protein